LVQFFSLENSCCGKLVEGIGGRKNIDKNFFLLQGIIGFEG
jgi:hypothetical protein